MRQETDIDLQRRHGHSIAGTIIPGTLCGWFRLCNVEYESAALAVAYLKVPIALQSASSGDGIVPPGGRLAITEGAVPGAR